MFAGNVELAHAIETLSLYSYTQPHLEPSLRTASRHNSNRV